jgi:hypothetical protein
VTQGTFFFLGKHVRIFVGTFVGLSRSIDHGAARDVVVLPFSLYKRLNVGGGREDAQGVAMGAMALVRLTIVIILCNMQCEIHKKNKREL